MKKILLTGCSGFIGMHLSKNLLEDDYEVLGLDDMNDYYNINLKKNRLKILSAYKNFEFKNVDISKLKNLSHVFKSFSPNKVVNLAAQAGVRYSLENPHVYIHSNVVGFMNILECCKNYGVEGLIYASSSSVYGNNNKIPFSVFDNVKSPISIYAVTKNTNELMANAYNHLYQLHTTGLRYFTVYGPWGRPDMAMYIFAEKINRGEPINVFNHGNMERDFTYIDDIIDGTRKSIEKNYSCEIFNLGNSKHESIMEIIKLIERNLGKKATINFMSMQPGDVKKTYADINYSKEKLGYSPKTGISKGVANFIEWYKSYNS